MDYDRTREETPSGRCGMCESVYVGGVACVRVCVWEGGMREGVYVGGVACVRVCVWEGGICEGV